MTHTPAHPTLIVIDGHALLHRAFHAVPPLTSPSGELVNAVYGFTTILLKVLKEYAPTHIAVTFDTGEATFRHEAYKAYKATRAEQPDELYAQVDHIEDILAAFRIPVYAVDGFEADDVIGTIVAQAGSRQSVAVRPRILILTGDLDALQLVDEDVHVLALTTSMSQPTEYDAAKVCERYGLTPEQLIDYKALAGDPSDNIPGVSGIGKKTATAILQAFGTVEVAIAAAAQGKAVGAVSAKTLQKLLDAKDEIAFGKMLVTIRRDAPVVFDMDAAARKEIDREAAVHKLRELGFSSLLGRVGGKETRNKEQGTKARKTGKKKDQETELPLAVTSAEELARIVGGVTEVGACAFAMVHDDGSPRAAHPRAIGFAYDGHEAAAEPWGTALAATAGIFRDAGITKTTHDAKAAMHLLGRSHTPLAGAVDDTMLMSYLLAPGTRKHDVASVAFHELGVELGGETPEDEQAAEQAPVPVTPHAAQSFSPQAASAARAIAQLRPLLAQRLADEQLERVYREIDLPLVPVLYRMEHYGIALDTDALGKLSRRMHEQLDAADARIFAHAGHTFNVDSPQQLKTILFEEIGLEVRGIKKTAKGGKLSTAAAELEKLREAHPIIADILTHRELKKLVSTYVDALPALVDPMTGRVHSTFNQTVAATGRLSSDSPNLQNIPVTEPWGPAIRSAFIAEQGWQLVAFDYSQFELRVAAALSGDAALQRAFTSGHDIHAATGAEVFGVAPEDVTKDQRRVAKAINFGILYGMGSGTLAATAAISRDEAGEYISAYFAAYPQLATWIEETKALARSRGYVETLFGRKRYMPEITSGVPMVRAAAERMAVNMPVQGTQADLVKMAMIAADAWVQEQNAHSSSVIPRSSEESHTQHIQKGQEQRDSGTERIRMLLQVHDELVFEVREDFIDEAIPALADILEHIYKLPVPIVVEARAGKSWGEMERMRLDGAAQ
ncbi:MAG: DNA polymerase I [bacterium]|nr:DNA polymerase I [bacterium]